MHIEQQPMNQRQLSLDSHQIRKSTGPALIFIVNRCFERRTDFSVVQRFTSVVCEHRDKRMRHAYVSELRKPQTSSTAGMSGFVDEFKLFCFIKKINTTFPACLFITTCMCLHNNCVDLHARTSVTCMGACNNTPTKLA